MKLDLLPGIRSKTWSSCTETCQATMQQRIIENQLKTCVLKFRIDNQLWRGSHYFLAAWRGSYSLNMCIIKSNQIIFSLRGTLLFGRPTCNATIIKYMHDTDMDNLACWNMYSIPLLFACGGLLASAHTPYQMIINHTVILPPLLFTLLTQRNVTTYSPYLNFLKL
jgi:hypothetical protein